MTWHKVTSNPSVLLVISTHTHKHIHAHIHTHTHACTHNTHTPPITALASSYCLKWGSKPQPLDSLSLHPSSLSCATPWERYHWLQQVSVRGYWHCHYWHLILSQCSRWSRHIHAALLCTGVGKRRTPSTCLAHPCCTSMHRCGEAANSKHLFGTSMLHFYAQVWGSGELQALVWHIHAALLCTGVGKRQTPSTGLAHSCCTSMHRCGEAANSKHWFGTFMLHFYAQVWGSGKLQALDYNILPPLTAIVDYITGHKKMSVNRVLWGCSNGS